MTKDQMSMEDRIELAFWEFDARKAGTMTGLQQSERDAYKNSVRDLLADRRLK